MSIINSNGFEQHIYDSMNNPSLIPQYSCTHKTRAFTKQVDEKGATVGCSSMQLYLMIRIALYAHFPKLFESPSTSALFLKIERKIFIIIVHLHRKLFNKDKLEFRRIFFPFLLEPKTWPIATLLGQSIGSFIICLIFF